jgi:Spy/CpxP family protein refolding chaperone
MERPKQQALAFLLGAVLVGGVVGFSADRMLRRDDTSIAEKRKAMYDDLGLQDVQRRSMDSLFDARNCQYAAIFNPIQPALDSLRASTRAQMNRILTADQRAKLESRRKDDDARHAGERQRLKDACGVRAGA